MLNRLIPVAIRFPLVTEPLVGITSVVPPSPTAKTDPAPFPIARARKLAVVLLVICVMLPPLHLSSVPPSPATYAAVPVALAVTARRDLDPAGLVTVFHVAPSQAKITPLSPTMRTLFGAMPPTAWKLVVGAEGNASLHQPRQNENEACTRVSWLTVTTHLLVPEQFPPDQPVKVPLSSFGVSVIWLPFITMSEQPFPRPSQLIPMGCEVTIP